jgi:uncharacterized repeat protein (TIGR03843 family)
LTVGAIEVEGRLLESSNRALRTVLHLSEARTRAIYKPIVTERPLWDFPDGTLARREVAAYAVSEAGGWGLVPPTVLREGPAGDGSFQQWIESPVVTEGEADAALLAILPPDDVADGWLPVLEAQGPAGEPVVVAHADRPDLASAAVFDAVVNNADRKGSHLLLDAEGHLWGFDHGVTFHAEPKLRTLLWGWAGRPLPEIDLARLESVRAALSDADSELSGQLAPLLLADEVTALRQRLTALLGSARFPSPPDEGPAIPWPPW